MSTRTGPDRPTEPADGGGRGDVSEMNDCTCDACRGACESRPGWFLPGEVEAVASFLGVPLAELFRTKLAVDWWEGDEENTFLLAPAIDDEEPGTEYPGNPRGRCVFLTDEGRCAIHAVKPHECRAYLHGQSQREVEVRHEAVAVAWGEHREQIRDLLGREPRAEQYEGGGLLGLLGFGW